MSACDMALLLVISREVLIKNGLGNSFFCKLSDSLICKHEATPMGQLQQITGRNPSNIAAL
ncbi:TPA: hypothetical protein ACG0L7_001801 [Enterobacter hormaechei subsp. oharae]